VFTFESPAALFRVLTPKRWELVERLRALGAMAGARGVTRVVALCLLLAACSSTVDLSRAEQEATDYVPGTVYVLLHDRYLEYQSWPPGVGRPVIVANSLLYFRDGPSSVEEFRAEPSRWPRILGVLPAGTRLRFERIERHSYPMLESWYEACGVVEDGEFRGREVELMWISAGVPDSRMLLVDPQEIRPAM
jgi:hypothetical protein